MSNLNSILGELANGYNRAKHQQQKEEQTAKLAKDLRERECDRIRDEVILPAFEKMNRWCKAKGIDCKLDLTPSDTAILFATQFFIGPPYPADHWPSIIIYTNNDMEYFYCRQEFKLGLNDALDSAGSQQRWKLTEMTKEIVLEVSVDFAQNALEAFQPQTEAGTTDARQTRPGFNVIPLVIGAMLGRDSRGIKRLNCGGRTQGGIDPA
jgi:hypothetical protein